MFSIKPVSEMDIPAIWEDFWRAYNKNPTTFAEAPADLWKRLRAPASLLEGVLIFDDGKPAGFAHYRLFETTSGAKLECYLQDLYIAPDHRSKGAGSFALGWFKEQAKLRGWSKVTLKTRKDNGAAQKLYDRLCERKESHIHYVVADLGQ